MDISNCNYPVKVKVEVEPDDDQDVKVDINSTAAGYCNGISNIEFVNLSNQLCTGTTIKDELIKEEFDPEESAECKGHPFDTTAAGIFNVKQEILYEDPCKDDFNDLKVEPNFNSSPQVSPNCSQGGSKSSNSSYVEESDSNSDTTTDSDSASDYETQNPARHLKSATLILERLPLVLEANQDLDMTFNLNDLIFSRYICRDRERIKSIEKERKQQRLRAVNKFRRSKMDADRVRTPNSKIIYYSCHICDKLFRSKVLLNKHLTTKHEVGKIGKKPQDLVKCLLCTDADVYFSNSVILTRHMDLAHIKPLEEPVILKVDHDELEKFLKEKEKPNKSNFPFSCHFCLAGFNNEAVTQFHTRLHFFNCVNGEMSCAICLEIKFTCKDRLQFHVLKNHNIEDIKEIIYSSEKRTWKCPICGIDLEKRNWLESHLNLMHSFDPKKIEHLFDKIVENMDPVQPVLKSISKPNQNQKPKLVENMDPVQDVLNSLKTPYQKPKDLSDIESEESDIGTLYGSTSDSDDETSDEEKFQCIVCSEDFLTKRLLQKHTRNAHNQNELKNSSQVELYFCHLCPQLRGFSTEKWLKFHTSSKHKEIKVEPMEVVVKNELEVDNDYEDNNEIFYNCNFEKCKKQFTSEKLFDLHVASFHKEKPTQLFICEFCRKEYKTKSMYLQHKRWIHKTLRKL